MDERGKGSGGGFRPPSREGGKAREHSVRLLEPDVRELAAVPGVPAERRPSEPRRLVNQEEDDFEGVWEADVVELCRGGQRDGGVEPLGLMADLQNPGVRRRALAREGSSERGRLPITPSVTITLGRLLAYAVGMVVAAGVAVFGWQAFVSGGAAFRDRASSICSEHLPAIANAPDFQTALGQSRDMRVRLSELTPPDEHREAFAAWLAALKGTEDAALRGDMAAVQAYDASLQPHVMALDLGDACIYRLS